MKNISREDAKRIIVATLKGGFGMIPFAGGFLSEYIGLADEINSSKQFEEKLKQVFDEHQRHIDEKLYNFMVDIEERISRIPSDRLVVPPAFIFEPALEQSRYYYDQEYLRNMFATLIVNLFDIQMYRTVHPSYIDIIKQLSPVDAKLLVSFRPRTANYIYLSGLYRVDKDGNHTDMDGNPIPDTEAEFAIPKDLEPSHYTFPETVKPMVSYWLSSSTSRLLIQNNIVQTDVISDALLVSSSITNLERLGLIETSYNTKLKESAYDFSLIHPFYIDWIDFNENTSNAVTMRGVRANMVTPKQFERIDIQKGIARLTQFGFNFISACAIESEVVRT